MFSKKQTIILIVLVLVLVGAIFFYQQKYDKWPWQNGVNVASPTATISPGASGTPQNEEQDLRQVVMKDVASRIAELSPVEPVLGGHWFAKRFWFIDGSYSTFYVEYEDGHILRQLLLTADTSKTPQKISYRTDAYFEAGESGWILRSGKDQESTLPLILFEFDQAAGRWVQKN